jgi:hypothetical protein
MSIRIEADELALSAWPCGRLIIELRGNPLNVQQEGAWCAISP